MSTGQPGSTRHVGKKIWYGTVIALSAIVIVLSAVGVVGTWVVGTALSDVAVQLLEGVERAAGVVEQLAADVDQGVGEIQALTTQVGEAARQIGENVTDQGLLLTLLPEEREQRLVERVQGLAANLAAIREVVQSALQMYQAVDALPFVSLPKPATDTVERMQQTVDELQTGVQDLAQAIKDFRAGVAGAVGRVTELTDRIGSRLDQSQQNLTALQTGMVSLQQQAASLQQSVPTFFTIASLAITIFLVFVLYTQVEAIRLFVGRWRSLNVPLVPLPETVVSTPASEEFAPPPDDELLMDDSPVDDSPVDDSLGESPGEA